MSKTAFILLAALLFGAALFFAYAALNTAVSIKYTEAAHDQLYRDLLLNKLFAYLCGATLLTGIVFRKSLLRPGPNN